MALQSRADELTFDTFAGRLLQESARRQVAQVRQPHLGQNTSSGGAFTAKYPMRGRNIGGRYGLRRGGMRTPMAFGVARSDTPGTNLKGVGTSKVKGKCFYCQKEGHWKRDCFRRKADEGKEALPTTGRDQGGLAFTVLDSEMPGQHSEIGYWIVDSGASQHLCGSKKDFIRGTYKEIIPRGIEIADQSKMQAVGQGDVSMGQLQLSNVLYVPQLGTNLLSVARIIDCGWDVRFTSARCTIAKKEIAFQGEREGNLYYLRIPEGYVQAHIGLATNKAQPQTLEIWHRRLGHRTLDESTVEYLSNKVTEFNIKQSKHHKGEKELCGTCAVGRQHKEASTGTREKTKELLDVVHSDICGPMQISTLTCEKYFITFIDEKSGRIAVTLLQRKDQALQAFQAYKARAENDAGRKIRILRTDGGGEYTGHHFQHYLRNCGIVHSVSPPYSPKQNGIAERANRTLMEGARCMIEDSKLTKSFWGYTVATAAHIHNRIPSQSHQDKSPLEHWTGVVPSIGHLRVFGSVTYLHIPAETRKKLDARSRKCILIGYDENSSRKTYRVYDPSLRRTISSRDVIIDERQIGQLTEERGKETDEMEFSLPEPEVGEPNMREEERGTPLERITPPGSSGEESDSEEFGGETIVVRPPTSIVRTTEKEVSLSGPRRSERQRTTGENFPRAMVANIEEPQTLAEAFGREDGAQWREAWVSEVDSLARNNTWRLEVLPQGRQAIGCRWLFRRKEDGRYKARLVAKGYSQREGVDYTETFAPVAKFNSLRSLLALVAENDWELEGMDVKTAFLNSEVEETIYMEIPEGLDIEETGPPTNQRMACRLIKSIYGLKQSPRAWYGKINRFFVDHGFQRSERDHSVYIHTIFKLILLLYVDDLVITAPSLEDVNWIRSLLHEEFEMTDLGPLTVYLGIEIRRNRQLRSLHVSQQQYIRTILDRFGMSTATTISTPADPHVRLTALPPDQRADIINQERYQSAVGSLMYAMIGTRPDIAFAVSAVSQYCTNPGPMHWTAVRRIFRYLGGTKALGLEYRGSCCGGYTDADWGSGEDRRSIGGYVFMINGAAISWASKKQGSVALSSTEAEYMSLTQGIKEALWLGELLSDLGAPRHKTEIRQVQCDNQGAITLTRNPQYHARTKHIDIQYHFVRQHIESGLIQLTYCPTHEMVADIFTKPLPRPQFEKHVLGLGLTKSANHKNNKFRKLNRDTREE